ncbi:3712_t:CDS:2 [Entrophospora sp. SA101]|nr:3712_t:CDS:2 [Entrophospora sp. SA101]
MAFVNANNIEQIVESNSINYIEESAGPEAIYNKRETRNAVINDDKQDQNLEKIVKQSIRKSRPRKEVDEQDPAKSFLEKWKFKDPGICCVCLEGATDVGNMLVYCDGQKCEVICHQECHGIKNLPSTDDPWYCDKCLAKPSEVVSCILCPKKTGAFRRLHEEDDFKTNSWVHLVCALWMPGMWIANIQKLNECSIANIEKENWRKECCICPRELSSQGAAVSCDANGCENWIHYCKDHCSQAGAVHLNKWEMWILERDNFLDNAKSEVLQKRNDQLRNGLTDQEKILREIFEDKYFEYQKYREKRIINLKENLIFRVEKFVERMSEKDVADDKNQNIDSNANNNNEDSERNDVEIKQYAECSTYKEAEIQIRNGLLTKSMNEIQQSLAKLPDSLLGWNSNCVEEAKNIDVKELDFKEIETLRLDNAQKILVQRQNEHEQQIEKGKKTIIPNTNKINNSLIGIDMFGSTDGIINAFHTSINITNEILGKMPPKKPSVEKRKKSASVSDFLLQHNCHLISNLKSGHIPRCEKCDPTNTDGNGSTIDSIDEFIIKDKQGKEKKAGIDHIAPKKTETVFIGK